MSFVCVQHLSVVVNTDGPEPIPLVQLGDWNQVNFQTTWEECEAQVPTAS